MRNTFRRRALVAAMQSAFATLALGGTAFAQDAPPPTETITVSGSRLPASLRTMPQSVQIIEAEDIDKQSLVSPNMADILQNLVPSISRASNTAVNTYTSVRGRKPVILIDGAPITSTLNDTAREINLIDPDSIRRIEVIPGSSALYGNSAGAGFINYVTKAGERGRGMRTEVGAEASLTEFTRDGISPYGRQTFSGAAGAVDYRFTGMYKQVENFYDADGNVIPPQLGSALQNSTIKSAMGKVGYNFAGRQRLEGSFSYYNQEAEIKWAVRNGDIANGIPASAIHAVPQPGQVPEEHDAFVANLVYSNPAIANTTTSFRAQGYYVDTESWFQYALNRFPLFPEAPSGQSGNRTRKTGARFDLNTPLRTLAPMDGTILWGLDLMRDDTKIPLVDGRQFGIPQVLESAAVFVQLQLAPIQNLRLSAGIRHEKSDLEVEDYLSVFTRARITGGTLEFSTTPKNVGAVYSLTKAFDLYAGFSQGFDIQQTSQNFRAWPVDINLVQTKPPANVIDSYEAGIRFSTPELRATLGYYQLESSNGISYVFNAATPNEPRAVVAPDKVKGWEATLDYTGIANWNFGMTYARSRGHADNDNNGSFETPLQNRRIAPPSFTAYAEHEFGNGTVVRVQALHSGERNAFPNTVPGRFHEGRVNSWTTVDALARFPIGKRMELSAGIRNLLNEDYYTNYSEGFNTNDNYLKAPGRTLTVRFAMNY
ncbi:MAG TPA: TonB-dependent receptor [Usitatibacter sp.]|nr:TonB-dependent receptor [Usitatibacter sp.]